MYFDLNIDFEIYENYISNNDQSFILLVNRCIEDGYNGIAINFDIKAEQLSNKHMNRFVRPQNIQSDFKIYSRLTFLLSDNKQLQIVNDNNSIINSYDLVAIKCNNEKIFHQLCQENDYFDIITFDIDNKMPFLLRRNTFNAAIEKGIMFEINYSSAIIDEKKRKVVYQNAIQIIKQLRAKNVIISSNIKDILFHRSPNEVIILGISFGLNVDQSYSAVSQNNILCLKRSKFRKSFKGTICEAEQKDILEFEKLHQDRQVKKIKFDNQLDQLICIEQ